MSEFYRVRCRNGKTEIEIESSDREYVDRKLDELLRSFPEGGKKKRAVAKELAAPQPPAPEADAAQAVAPAVVAESKAAGKAAVKAARKKAAHLAKHSEPQPEAPMVAEAAAKPSNGVDAESFAQQIRRHARFAQIKKRILRQPSQLPRVLLCHYFADQLGHDLGLTAQQVEAITEQLGVRIAAPNVAKVIRQQAKKLFASERQDGITRHRITRSGLNAVEKLLAG